MIPAVWQRMLTDAQVLPIAHKDPFWPRWTVKKNKETYHIFILQYFVKRRYLPFKCETIFFISGSSGILESKSTLCISTFVPFKPKVKVILLRFLKSVPLLIMYFPFTWRKVT